MQEYVGRAECLWVETSSGHLCGIVYFVAVHSALSQQYITERSAGIAQEAMT